MRTDSFLLLGSILISSILILVSKPKTTKAFYIEKAISKINLEFQKDLQHLAEAAILFNEAVQQFKASKISKTSIQQEYRSLRAAFKKVEFILEYLDKEATDKLLNGAPLPKLEPKVADLTILQPKGLQVIDELMSPEIGLTEIASLAKMSKKLQKDIEHMQRYLEHKKFTDRQFFEASRQALIRLATLGVTGFDTPGTTLAIEDTKTVLKKLQAHLQQYAGELKNSRKEEILSTLNTHLTTGIEQAEKQDFNSFDRLSFINTVINPLYKEILNLHLSLGYETIEEVTRYDPAVNYRSENIFDADFLNKFYYASITNNDRFDVTAQLGKLLFYDPILSNTNKMACASCHSPEKAFTDGMKTSLSNTGVALKRNAMTLNYAIYASGFFHDMRTKRLEDQFEHVVLSKDEFATNYLQITKKLNESPTYVQKFKEAFPDQKQTITSNNIDYALVAYVMQLNSFDSQFDQYMQGKITTLPDNVARGFNLFTGKAACATCHFMPLFSGTVPPLYIESESEVLGVPNHKDTPLILDDDLGRLGNGLTQEVAPFFKNAFKTTTIRNISKTAPYMHNGVFDTLEEVMKFYNEGGGAGRGINIDQQTLAPDALDLTEAEIANIIAFMEALTDTTQFEAPKDLPRDFSKTAWNKRELIQ
jgi:cytochrome c peroxidase